MVSKRQVLKTKIEPSYLVLTLLLQSKNLVKKKITKVMRNTTKVNSRVLDVLVVAPKIIRGLVHLKNKDFIATWNRTHFVKWMICRYKFYI